MHQSHLFVAGKVGNGTSHFQNSVIGTSRHAEPVHCLFKMRKTITVGCGILPYPARCHLGIAMHSRLIAETHLLHFAGPDNSAAYRFAALRRRGRSHLIKLYRRDFYLYIDTVEQWPRNFAQILMHRTWRTHAGLGRMPVITARTRIHRCHKHE